MIQDRFHISASDAREPFEELINCRTITQVLKQSSYWNASAAKHKCSADFVMVSFDCIEIVPVSVQFIAPWNSDRSNSPDNRQFEFWWFMSYFCNSVYQPKRIMSPSFAGHRVWQGYWNGNE